MQERDKYADALGTAIAKMVLNGVGFISQWAIQIVIDPTPYAHMCVGQEELDSQSQHSHAQVQQGRAGKTKTLTLETGGGDVHTCPNSKV